MLLPLILTTLLKVHSKKKKGFDLAPFCHNRGPSSTGAYQHLKISQVDDKESSTNGNIADKIKFYNKLRDRCVCYIKTMTRVINSEQIAQKCE